MASVAKSSPSDYGLDPVCNKSLVDGRFDIEAPNIGSSIVYVGRYLVVTRWNSLDIHHYGRVRQSVGSLQYIPEQTEYITLAYSIVLLITGSILVHIQCK